MFSLRKGKKASKILNVFKPLPQILENISVKNKDIINNNKSKNAIKKANKIMGKQRKNFSKKIWNRAEKNKDYG